MFLKELSSIRQLVGIDRRQQHPFHVSVLDPIAGAVDRHTPRNAQSGMMPDCYHACLTKPGG